MTFLPPAGSTGTDVAVLPVGGAPVRPLGVIARGLSAGGLSARGLSADGGPPLRPAGGRIWPSAGPCHTAPSSPALPPWPMRGVAAPSPAPPTASVPDARVEASVPAGESGSCVVASPPSARTPFGEFGVPFSAAGRAISAAGVVPAPAALPGTVGKTMLAACRSTSTTMGMGWVSAKVAISARSASVRLGLASVSVAAVTTSVRPGAAGTAPASQSRSSLPPGRGPGSPASGLALPSSVAGRDGTR